MKKIMIIQFSLIDKYVIIEFYFNILDGKKYQN